MMHLTDRRILAVATTVILAHALVLWGLLPGTPPRRAPLEPAQVLAAQLITTPPPTPSAAPIPSAPRATASAAPQRPRAPRQAAIAPTAPTVADEAAAAVATVAPATPAGPAETPPQPAAPAAQRQAPDAPPDAPAASATAAAAPPAPAGAPPARVELPSASAAYLNNPPPAYPALSRRLGEQGRVVLRVRIEPDGTASAAEIRTSSGYERLDQAALQAVLRWRYVPGRRNGVPEPMWFLVPIQFVLE